MHVYHRGDTGPPVAEIRSLLHHLGLLDGAARDGTSRDDGTARDGASRDGACFDERCDHAVRSFQQQRGLSVDGLVGPETYRALVEARWRLGDRLLSYAVGRPFVGDDVVTLQDRLQKLGFDVGRCDGIFGGHTEQALREFQRNVGLVVDGNCGPATLRSLRQLSHAVVGGRPQAMRETEVLHRSGPTLVGKSMVVDAGHGGADRGAIVGDLVEAELTADLASRLEGRLAAAGVSASLTHGPGRTLAESERATFANDSGADLLISLHVDAASSSRCQGAATYYYGTLAGPRSTIGERLAALVQREIVARTGLVDGRTHAKTWELLRRTRMPAIRLELGYLSHPNDGARLRDPAFRDRAAEAILAAVQRLYLPPDLDPPTGQLQIPTPVTVSEPQ